MSTTEAKYSFTTKINGDLFTIRGDSFEEFHTNVATAGLNLATFINDVAVIQGAGNAVPLVNASAPAAPQAPEWATPAPSAWQATTPPPAAATASVPACPHGPMKYVPGGVSKKTGNPYNAFYACTSGDRATQCKSKTA